MTQGDANAVKLCMWIDMTNEQIYSGIRPGKKPTLKYSTKRYRYTINGTKGKNLQPLRANCHAVNKQEAAFTFHHSPSLIGVKVNWKTLRLDRRSKRAKRKAVAVATIESLMREVISESGLPKKQSDQMFKRILSKNPLWTKKHIRKTITVTDPIDLDDWIAMIKKFIVEDSE